MILKELNKSINLRSKAGYFDLCQKLLTQFSDQKNLIKNSKNRRRLL